MQKLYCYVDENGIETKGRIFIVAMVVIGIDPQKIIAQCEEIERLSLKGTSKWRKTKHTHRIDYLRRVFATPDLQSRLCYAVFRVFRIMKPRLSRLSHEQYDTSHRVNIRLHLHRRAQQIEASHLWREAAKNRHCNP